MSPAVSLSPTCSGSEPRVPGGLELRAQEAGQAEQRAGDAGQVPGAVEAPRAAGLGDEAGGPVRGRGQQDVVAHLAARRGAVPGEALEGGLQGARRVWARGADGSASGGGGVSQGQPEILRDS